MPSYLGSSFAFIAPVTGAMATHGMGGALGGIVMAGACLFIVGLIVQKAGTGWIHALMPPVVMGTIVALIGLNLATTTTEKITTVPLTTFATVLAIVVSTVFFRGMLGRLSILLGIIVGYLVAWAQGQVDFSKIGDAPWIGLPDFSAPDLPPGHPDPVPARGVRADRRERRPREDRGADDRQGTRRRQRPRPDGRRRRDR